MAINTDVLHKVPLFAGMTDRSLQGIAGLARETTYDPGSVIVREGEPGESLFVIVSGSATVEQGGQTIKQLGAGERASAGSWTSIPSCATTLSAP